MTPKSAPWTALVRIDELEDRLSALEDDTPEPA